MFAFRFVKRMLFAINLYKSHSHQTGALAISVANPTDLVKVRLQAEGKFPVGVAMRYYGTLDAYYTIVRQVSFLRITISFFS